MLAYPLATLPGRRRNCGLFWVELVVRSNCEIIALLPLRPTIWQWVSPQGGSTPGCASSSEILMRGNLAARS